MTPSNVLRDAWRGCVGLLVILALLTPSAEPTDGLILLVIGLLAIRTFGCPRIGSRTTKERQHGAIEGESRQPPPAPAEGRSAMVVLDPGRRGHGGMPPWHGIRRAAEPMTEGRGRLHLLRADSAATEATMTDERVGRARDPVPAQLRFRVLQRDGFRCSYCGRPGSAPGVVLHVDHVVPLAHGGATSEDNLLAAGEECNLGKATRAVVAVEPDPR